MIIQNCIFKIFFRFLQCFQSAEKRNLGMLLRWLINDQNRTFFGMKLPTGFQMIGQTTLRQYTAWLDYFDRQSKMENPAFVTRVTKRAYARVGVSSAYLFLGQKEFRNIR